MKKINYIRALLESMPEDKLRSIIESYVKKDRSFEAFVIYKSGQAVDTGKTYEEYLDELMKIFKKCTSRKRGFVKVTRLKNAGMSSFVKMLNSHFSNENFRVSLWMSLALMEMLHKAILTNTRYLYSNKPFKSFEKLFLEARDLFDSSFRKVSIERKERKNIFSCFVRCWWAERQRNYSHRYFDSDYIFRYAERDEDYVSIQEALQNFYEEAKKSDKKKSQRLSSIKHLFGNNVYSDCIESSISLTSKLQEIEQRASKALQQW